MFDGKGSDPITPTAAPTDDFDRWLEDLSSSDVQAWFHEQNEHARAFLDMLPERETVRAALVACRGTQASIGAVQVGREHLYYLRRAPGAPAATVAMRRGIDAEEEIIFDPATLEDESGRVIDWFCPSPDDRVLAVALSIPGAEEGTVRFLDIETGVFRDDVLMDLPGSILFAWLDDQAVLYTPYRPVSNPPDSMPALPTRVFLHRLGNDSDIEVFNVEQDMASPTYAGVPTPWVSGNWVFVVIRYGADIDVELFGVSRTELVSPAHVPWRQLVTKDEQVTGYVLHDERLYLISERKAPRGCVLERMLEASNGDARVVLPERDTVLRSINVCERELVLLGRIDAHDVIEIYSLDDSQIRSAALPLVGSIGAVVVMPGTTQIVLDLESWFSPRNLYVGQLTTGYVVPLSSSRQQNITREGYTVDECAATSADGTRIPMSILHRADTPLDGSAPTILFGYGCYGISAGPIYWPHVLAWLSIGGVYVFSHIRGGGEFGRSWYEAGKGYNKRNAVADFLACAQHLVVEGVAMPQRLAAETGSAGGFVVGGGILRHPSLFRAILMRSVLLDGLRFESQPGGQLNVPEFGSIGTPEGLASLKELDVIRNITPDTQYPSALLTIGYRDARAPAWHAGKFAMRMRSVAHSMQPALLRIEFDGGHLWAQLADPLSEQTDAYAFLSHKLSAPHRTTSVE